MTACINYHFTTTTASASVTLVEIITEVSGQTASIDGKIQSDIASVEARPRISKSSVKSKINSDVETIHQEISVSVKPQFDDAASSTISVKVKKATSTVCPSFLFELSKVQTLAEISEQNIALFCPIDLIKSCFGSGRWLDYRPWLSDEAWRYATEN